MIDRVYQIGLEKSIEELAKLQDETENDFISRESLKALVCYKDILKGRPIDNNLLLETISTSIHLSIRDNLTDEQERLVNAVNISVAIFVYQMTAEKVEIAQLYGIYNKLGGSKMREMVDILSPRFMEDKYILTSGDFINTPNLRAAVSKALKNKGLSVKLIVNSEGPSQTEQVSMQFLPNQRPDLNMVGEDIVLIIDEKEGLSHVKEMFVKISGIQWDDETRVLKYEVTYAIKDE